MQRIDTRIARQPRQGFQLKPRECGSPSLKPPSKPVKKWVLTSEARSQSPETPQGKRSLRATAGVSVRRKP